MWTIPNILFKLRLSQMHHDTSANEYEVATTKLKIHSIRRFLLMDWNGASQWEKGSKKNLFF